MDWDTSIAFLELSKLEQWRICYKFLERANKKDGTRYPAGSLINLICSINREIWQHQKRRIMEIGVE